MHQGACRSAEDGQEIRLADKKFVQPAGVLSPGDESGKKLEQREVLLGSLPAFENSERFKCAAGRLLQISEGQLCLFWGMVPHQVTEVAEPTNFVCLYVPMSVLVTPDIQRSPVTKLYEEVVHADRGGCGLWSLRVRWKPTITASKSISSLGKINHRQENVHSLLPTRDGHQLSKCASDWTDLARSEVCVPWRIPVLFWR